MNPEEFKAKLELFQTHLDDHHARLLKAQFDIENRLEIRFSCSSETNLSNNSDADQAELFDNLALAKKKRQLLVLLAALPHAISYYRKSPILTLRRSAKIFRREGLKGILHRASLLVNATSVDENFLYGQIPPLSGDFMPLVSVIVPNYNHEPFLRQRLESIYQQTYSNIEVILLDDCSSDDSLSILNSYANRFPAKTICCFNNVNSGGVFYQWKKGLEFAKGELIWIAESDDYCSTSFLEEMVRCFHNKGVKLAFGYTNFVSGEQLETVWTLSQYLNDFGPSFWDKPFIKSANALVKSGWTFKNLVPNVSSAVFRHPGNIKLFEDPEWLHMRLCGDWVFYLYLIRGGLVAYNPNAVNYYRQHSSNTSVNAQKEDIYYREFEIVAKRIAATYEVDMDDLQKQEKVLYEHWCSRRGNDRLNEFCQLYNLDQCLLYAEKRCPNILMVTYALAAGGGETFPIILANELARRGYGVTLLNCHQQATEIGVFRMISPDVSLLEVERIELIPAICDDMAISLIHSHHAWVDTTLALLLKHRPNVKHVISTHGMYEMMPAQQIYDLTPLLSDEIDAFVYTAEKNLSNFPQALIREKNFYRIENALPLKPINPVSRQELDIEPEDFVLCLVARAIPEKGWEEAVEAVKMANADRKSVV